MSREPMLEMYLFEASQLIEKLEEIIIQCEKNKKFEMESVNEIFRIMHTIKGPTAMMMFNNIALLAHSLEDLFFFVRENNTVSLKADATISGRFEGVEKSLGMSSKPAKTSYSSPKVRIALSDREFGKY